LNALEELRYQSHEGESLTWIELCTRGGRGHPIIFLSSSILKKIIRRALQPEQSFCPPAPTASLSLYSNSAPKRYNYPAYLLSVAQHPLSRLQQFSERGPEKLSLYEVHLASMLLTGVLSRPQNRSYYGPALQ